MHPAVAGLIGAGLALVAVAFVYLIWRGRESRRLLEASRAEALTPELRQIFELVPSGALLVGGHDEIVYVNDTGTALGLARGNRVGFADLLERVRDVRATGKPYVGPVIREVLPGTERAQLSARVGPVKDGWVLVIVEDESAQRRVDAVRRDFVANISHELKTPIGAISVLSEAVEAAADDPEAVSRFATRLQMETSRLAELVNQIIDLTRLQSEDPMLTRDVVDIHEVVSEAVSRSKERAEKRQVSLMVARTTEAYVLGDRWQLADAVSNLVQNAINYSDERARVALSIMAVNDEGDQFVDVKVSDNGIGIKPEDLERIFERFYRVDYGRSRDSGGTGLGLSIVRHIALAHGGSIRVWSRPGQGSTFTLRLPMYLGPHPDADPAEEEPS